MKTPSQTSTDNSTLHNPFYDFIALLFVFAILSIDFFPMFDALEIIEPQYLFLAFLSVISSVFIYFNFNLVTTGFLFKVKNSKLFWLYLIFILLSGLSVVMSTNFSVSLISWTNLGIVFCLVFNLLIVFNDRLYLLPKIIFLVIFAAFLQALMGLFKLTSETGTNSFVYAVARFMGNTGNINVYAASLCIKIPFVLFGIVSNSKKLRNFSFIVLFVLSSSVFLTASRAIFIAYCCIVFLFIMGRYYAFGFNRTNKITFSIIILISLISIVTVSALFKTIDSGRYQSLDKRMSVQVETDASAQVRLTLWKNAFSIVSESPFFGTGLGTWKVQAVPYEKLLFTGSTTSVHAHSDFLEVMAETGLLNGLVYFGFICLLIFINFKRFKAEPSSVQPILCLLILVVYLIDTLFNFPLHRPTMQIIFCFCIVLTILNSEFIGSHLYKYTKVAIVGFIFFACFLFYFSFLSFKSSKLERIILTNSASISPQEIVSQLPKYPNLGVYGIPFAQYAGIKFYLDNQYPDAITYLKQAKKLNPFAESYYYLHLICKNKGQVDSAYYYINESFKMRPRYDSYFYNYLDMAKIKKDTSAILRGHTIYNKLNKSPFNWRFTSDQLYDSNYGLNKVIQFLDKGLIEFPGDKSLIEHKLSFVAHKYYEKLDYKNAILYYDKVLQLNPNNSLIAKNAGNCYVVLGDFKKAIYYLNKALTSTNPETDGKAEFLLGFCYMKLNQKSNACKYLKIADEKHFTGALDLAKNYCQ